MSRALDEFYAAVAEEFGVDLGDAGATLETPGQVVGFVVDNTAPTDGLDDGNYREHVAGVVGEIMVRTLGITRYSESSRFADLQAR
ncbi:MAG: hypothetical protein ABI442_14820 [Gemmatimonadaceae bacterium]